MSESYSLPTEPEGMGASLRERFNSGKVSAMMTLYEPEAVLVAKDGRTVTGHSEITAELERGPAASPDRGRCADGTSAERQVTEPGT